MSKAIILPPVPTGSEKVHVREDTSKRANTLTTVQTLDDDNSIYAISDSNTVTVYCLGSYLE